MPPLKALALQDHLTDAAGAAICVLVGNDDSLRARSLLLLKEAAAPSDQPGSTVREFEGSPEPRDVLDELRTVPFLGLAGRRVVVITQADPFLTEHWQLLLAYLRSAPETSTLILCVDRLAPKSPPGRALKDADKEAARKKAWGQFLKAVNASGIIVDCSRLRWGDAKSWVRQRAGRLGKKLTPRAADSLLEAVGPNLLALESELQKLCLYADSRDAVTDRDVAELVSAARSRSVFELAEAVGRGDAAAALGLCAGLLLSGESREGIISVLALQLRRLWQMKRLHAAGAPPDRIAREAGVPAFAVRRAVGVLRSLTDERLARQINVLAAADAESKTASLRAQEERVWLEGLLARLCQS